MCSENFPVSSPYYFRFPLVRQIYFTWIPLFVYICVVFNCKTKDISMIKCIFMTSWLLSNETFYFWILLLTCHFHIFGTWKNYETCSQSNFCFAWSEIFSVCSRNTIAQPKYVICEFDVCCKQLSFCTLITHWRLTYHFGKLHWPDFWSNCWTHWVERLRMHVLFISVGFPNIIQENALDNKYIPNGIDIITLDFHAYHKRNWHS